MKDTILVAIIAATVSFFATGANAMAPTLDLDPSATLLDDSPEIVVSGESTLDKLKRWNKMIRGKEAIYTTTGGTRFTVDVIGSEKSLALFKPF